MSSSLLDSLRWAERVVADWAAQLGVPLRLRGGVHYGDVLQVVDGAFAGQMIGRTLGMMDEVVEAARWGDHLARSLLNVAVTATARDRLQLPVRAVSVRPGSEAQLISGGEELAFLESPPPKPAEAGPGRAAATALAGPVYGQVMFLDLKVGTGGEAFPRLGVYLRTMRELCELACLAGYEILNIMSTSVLAFAEYARDSSGCLAQALDRLHGDGPALLERARLAGWERLQLRAGLLPGFIYRPLNGPLAGQALGPALALAARLKVEAAKNARGAVGLAIPEAEFWKRRGLPAPFGPQGVDRPPGVTDRTVGSRAKNLADAGLERVSVLSAG